MMEEDSRVLENVLVVLEHKLVVLRILEKVVLVIEEVLGSLWMFHPTAEVMKRSWTEFQGTRFYGFFIRCQEN